MDTSIVFDVGLSATQTPSVQGRAMEPDEYDPFTDPNNYGDEEPYEEPLEYVFPARFKLNPKGYDHEGNPWHADYPPRPEGYDPNISIYNPDMDLPYWERRKKFADQALKGLSPLDALGFSSLAENAFAPGPDYDITTPPLFDDKFMEAGPYLPMVPTPDYMKFVTGLPKIYDLVVNDTLPA